MSLATKLNTLSEVTGPERISLLELTDAAGYRITAARQYLHATFGPTVIIEINFKEDERLCFLPKRYGLSLSPADIADLGGGEYRIKCTGVKNNSPILDIFKA